MADDLTYDEETSSDDEYDGTKYPYNIHKSGREYIYIGAHYDIIVPSYEFEKVYGDILQVLKSGCKNITINQFGSNNYYFDD
jgi:hypothetical protein